ncbi:MAG TPA: hypothetical protein VJZ71_15355 [Phycisphaerae bacterium]|nr:hypothetical protein [Phycisphaerae bacterium]
MQISIKTDAYTRGILLLILGCLAWLCLEKTTSSPALASSDDDPPKEKAPKVRELVAARAFVLLDENGKIRAALSTKTGGPSLTFMDSKGNNNVRLEIDELSFTLEGESLFNLRLSKSGSRLQLRDHDEKNSANLFVGDGGRISFSLDGEKEQGISLRKDADGMTSLSLRGNRNQEVSLMTTPRGDAILSLGDNERAEISLYSSLCTAGLVVQDDENVPRVVLGSGWDSVEKEPSSWIRILGKDGKNNWKAP